MFYNLFLFLEFMYLIHKGFYPLKTDAVTPVAAVLEMRSHYQRIGRVHIGFHVVDIDAGAHKDGYLHVFFHALYFVEIGFETGGRAGDYHSVAHEKLGRVSGLLDRYIACDGVRAS